MKILMACPTVGLYPDPEKWLRSFLNTFNDILSVKGTQVGTFFPYRKPIHIADNSIAKQAIDGGYDYILRMDDDIWGVPVGAVKKLLDADKDFISAVMYIGGFPYSKCAFRKVNKNASLIDIARKQNEKLEEINLPGAQPCDLTAFPFTLWKVSMFKKLKEPYFEVYPDVPEDSIFCQKCLDSGIQPYVHMDIAVNHKEVTPYNRMFLFQAEAEHRFRSGLIKEDDPLYKIIKDEIDKCEAIKKDKEGNKNG